MLALIGYKSEIVFKPLPQNDPKRRKPNLTKARRLLGWEPKLEPIYGNYLPLSRGMVCSF